MSRRTVRRQKGDCFEAALKVQLNAFQECPRGSLGQAVLVVHGVVTGQGPIAGLRIAHAWNEVGGAVIDASNGRLVVLPAELYYRIGEVLEGEVRRYDLAAARHALAATGHCGPWHDCGGATA